MGYFTEQDTYMSSSCSVDWKKCGHKNLKKEVFITLLSLVLLVGCNTSSSSWAYDFVKYDNRHYIPIEGKIKVDDLNEKIGQVKVFLDQERDSINLSSNKFAKGTELYSIKGVDVKEEIVVIEKDGKLSKLKAE